MIITEIEFKKVYPRTKFLLNKKINYLLPINFIKDDNKLKWECLCDCGNRIFILHSNLISGHTQSCGCLRRNQLLTHGMSYSNTYKVWNHIIDRCNRPNTKKYKNYGGRGIKVCERWLNSFEEFYKDVRDKPDKLSLDRIDNNLHYSCGKCGECIKNNWKMNCRWATINIQNKNKRNNILVTYNGKIQCLMDWSIELNIPYMFLYRRLKKKDFKDLIKDFNINE